MNTRILAVVLALSMWLTGCQSGRGLKEIKEGRDLRAYEGMTFYIFPMDRTYDASDWIRSLAEFVPKECIHSLPPKNYSASEYTVLVRIKSREHAINLLTMVPSALTLALIPGCMFASHEADFEVYRSATEAAAPIRFHYEFSQTNCAWLPIKLFGFIERADSKKMLYRQFFTDYEQWRMQYAEAGGRHE